MPIQLTDDFITVHDLRFHYRRWSPEQVNSNQPALLLLHGLASGLRIWDFVAPSLAEAGYLVIALDQRGHGLSDKPDHGYDYASIVADDAALADALGLTSYVLVGHSWGASVALSFAVEHPKEVTALVLVDGASSQLSGTDGWTRELALERLAPPRFAGTKRADFVARIKNGPFGPELLPQIEDIILNIVELRADDTVAPSLAYENHLQIIEAMWEQPTFSLYQQANCPITLIVAEPTVPNATQSEFLRQRNDNLAQIQAIRPETTIIRMSDTIHDIPLHKPVELVEIIIAATKATRI